MSRHPPRVDHWCFHQYVFYVWKYTEYTEIETYTERANDVQGSLVLPMFLNKQTTLTFYQQYFK